MAIFTRRRVQAMIDDLGPWLTKAKVKDLLNRLDNRDPDQAIPAEYELAVGWALTRIGKTTFEPAVGKKAPDYLAHELFPGQEAVIEVAALSDDSLSGESSMDRTANIINAFADTVRKGASDNLFFQFLEMSGYEPVPIPGSVWKRSQFFRRRLTSKKFQLTDDHRDQLRAWLAVWPPTEGLRIQGEGTDLIVSWKDYVHPHGRCHSSMPSLVHSLTDNPLYARLQEKEREQLKGADASLMRCIFLGDAGCRLLRVPKEYDPTGRVVSGQQIISHFIENSTVDLVVVFSPRRRNENAFHYHDNPRIWHVEYYEKKPQPKAFYDGLERIASLLPKPYLHGYQARSWIQQGMLSPQARGQYEPLTITSGRTGLKAKVSARAVFEMMAGRMSGEDIQRWVTGDSNHFERWLAQGYGVKDVTFESGGLDRDDDYIVFHLEPDPNASPLRPPEAEPGGGSSDMPD